MEKYLAVFDDRADLWAENKDQNLMFLEAIQNYFNELLNSRGHVFLNEIHDTLGIKRTPKGQIVGWLKSNTSFIDFGISVKDNNTIFLNFNVDGVIYEQI